MKKLLLLLISLVIYFITRLLHMSYRYRYENNGALKALKKEKKNFIFAIWHQGLFPGILAQTGLQHIVIVSKSKDAEPVAFACKHLGHLVVRGSSRKGNVDKNGQAAKEEMIECLKAGHPGAVTVDGPKGPAFKVKPGIIDMAKKSKALLVPYVVCPKTYWEFKSWDNFRLPKPFSKILISYGDPIKVDEETSSFENDQLKLEQALNSLTVQTQNHLKNWEDHSFYNWWHSKSQS
ncbi:MAG: lysophospholipid acyltransferase family protein [Bdellovibrionales bacterium]|nr:lysophospholipid acyltransferase family protein [Bdellovibrionales bacterium]